MSVDHYEFCIIFNCRINKPLHERDYISCKNKSFYKSISIRIRLNSIYTAWTKIIAYHLLYIENNHITGQQDGNHEIFLEEDCWRSSISFKLLFTKTDKSPNSNEISIIIDHLFFFPSAANINESCFFTEQCEVTVAQTECRDGRCICIFEKIPVLQKDGSYHCVGES